MGSSARGDIASLAASVDKCKMRDRKKICSTCGAAGARKRCNGGCAQQPRYCDKECQVVHWRSSHKQECGWKSSHA